MTTSITQTNQGMAVTGNLVYANVTELLNKANQYIETNRNSDKDKFIIDCKNMKRIDSAGIALLIDWQRESSKANKTCHFVEMSDQVKSLIQAYRLQPLFGI